MANRLVTISFTGLDAGGGVPKFNRDLHDAFPDRERIHFCAQDLPSNEHRRWEWEQARALNLHLVQTKKITRDDVIVADGFWAAGLESFPHAISHSHGIWSHLTFEDVLNGKQPENPFHHVAQVDFRRRWIKSGRALTAVSGFISTQMYLQWGFLTDRVIENGVDTERYKPMEYRTSYLRDEPLIIHGVNDRSNVNKGWDHIQLLIDSLPGVRVMSLDEANDQFVFFSDRPWEKHEVLSQATLVVHPSGYEGNSMFVAEALASGVPVIGYDVGYMYSLQELPTVIDRRRRSPELTLGAVRDTLANPAIMRLSAEMGRKIAVDELSIEKFRNRWRTFIEGVENA
jgi:glycosyltransferase involved in cell wall biosynthesis